MRIRKRKVPLPLSLLSPVPLSDPHLFGRSPVTVQQLPSHPNTPLLPQPSDHLPLTSSHSSASDLRSRFIVGDTTTTAVKEQLFCWKQESNDASNGKMGARPPPDDDDDNGGLTQMSSQVPLKKEKMIFQQKDKHDHDHNHDHKEGGSGEAKKGIRKSRGSTIMEGSRCSRVNGRGWRCCQPTLVGYSLCEHHLGKGRLRSMTTVRGRPSKAAPPPLPPQQPQQLQKNEAKRVKLGMVKARSLSSLLGQTTNTTIINVDNGVAAGEINVNHGNNNDLIKDKP